MNLKTTFCFLIVLIIIYGCQLEKMNSNNSDTANLKCGYELTMEEWNKIQSETYNINPFLTENSSEVFLEIYDTLKNNIDSNVIYELSLTNLKLDEIWLDLKVAKPELSANEIVCLIMNSEFSQQVPRQRKIRIFEKNFNDSLGRKQNIIIGIKRIK